LNKLKMRNWLLATSMISSVATLAIAGAANAADATADAGVMATMTGQTQAVGTPSAPIQTVTASTDATDSSGTTVQELVVTGSRIPQPNLTSVSPIQAVSKQEFQLEGHTDVIDLLNNLPQEFQSNTTDFSNTTNPLTGPGGITTADLRGLGPQRTLVLVNGRRLGIGDANTGNPNAAPDLDQIPAAMIDHVEVLTGGASATYGSDAIAGVVNFILKQNFEGVEIDGTLGGDQSSPHQGTVDAAIQRAVAGGITSPIAKPGSTFDGQNEDVSLIMGTNAPDDQGNVTAYFEYHHQSPVLYKDRDFSACDFVRTGGGTCVGSANSNLLFPLSATAPGCPGGVPPGGSGTCTVVGHSLLPWPQANTSPPSYFNSNNYEYLSRADTRYIAGFEAHYDFNKSAQIYSEFNFMSDQTIEHIAPSGAFAGGNPFDVTGSGGFQINCDNPLMSAEEATALCGAAAGTSALTDVLVGHRNIEGGPRISDYQHFNYRGVIGMRGDIGDAWHYDVYGSYYYTFLYQANENYLSYQRIGNALDVVNTATGPQCAVAVAGTDTACVPYNIFQTGGVTQAALNYLSVIGTESGSVTEQIAEGDFTGDLGKYGIKSPWATDGVRVAVGFDWRRDQLAFQPDAEVGSGDLAGGSGVGATINQGLGVWEGYGETQIPIVQDAPFAHLLELEGGLRYSAYSSGPTPLTYRIGMKWSPIEDIQFRASYNLAIRAPSVIELYNPVTVTQSDQFGTSGDPCSGAHPTDTLAQCERTGVTAAEYGHVVQCVADQCDASTGGNAALQPEQAETYTFGVQLQPHWVHGLTASVDFWDIREFGFVGTIAPNIVVNECATNGSFCDLIHRAPGTGFLFGPSDLASGGYVVGTGQNIGGGTAEGIDFQADYRLDLDDVGAKGMGSLQFTLNGSLQLDASAVLPVGRDNCNGLYGSECGVNPEWRHVFRLTWNTPWNVLASLQWRYIGGTSLDTNTSQPLLTNGAFDAFDARLPAVNYLDLSGAWRVNSIVTVRAGVNNILDQDPPLIDDRITGTGTPNSYPTYDLLGRELFLSATAKF
jgi:outer membrane receptor protein involved in Fe transport